MNRQTIILKFGGTSVSNRQGIDAIYSVVKKKRQRYAPVVVVSALSNVTNLLLALAKSPALKKSIFSEIQEIHKKLIRSIFSKEEDIQDCLSYMQEQLVEIEKLIRKKQTRSSIDHIIGFGEIISSHIVSKALQTRFINAQQVIATNIIVTDDHFGSAEFLVDETKVKVKKILLPFIKNDVVPIVTGFIGATKKHQITTLGRGGSDYTASILGFCLQSCEIQIWTDVDGVFSADPRMVKEAKLLKTISYKEASEMAWFGAKVFHPRTIRPAISAKIPVRVLNTFNLKVKGTIIKEKLVKNHSVTAVSCKKKITLVNMYSTSMLFSKGFLVKIFAVFAKNNISVDLVSVSEVSVSVTLDNDENLRKAVEELSTFTSVSMRKDLGMISVIGDGIVALPHLTQQIFGFLQKEHIMVKMVSLGATDINISLVIPSEKIEHMVNVFHSRLLLKKVVDFGL